MTLFRSWMFIPGNQPRRLAKAGELAADVLIYDLEDAVPLAEKEQARQLVRQALRENKSRVQYVRVNDPSTPFFPGDINGAVSPETAGIVLPKAAGKEQILAACGQLALVEAQHNLPTGVTEIVPLIESAAGLYRAYEIATASSRVKRLAFGSVDFTLDIGAQLTTEGKEILYARSQLVVISRAAEIEPPIDAVFVQVKDGEGLKRDALLARQLGFQGKLAIHPDQLPVIHQAFSPTAEEIAEAQAIAAAFDEAVASGSAAIQVNGKLVDYPVAVRAKRVLEQARALRNE
jgi:citrate lyase subunit beta/citryl-CoA lyase